MVGRHFIGLALLVACLPLYAADTGAAALDYHWGLQFVYYTLPFSVGMFLLSMLLNGIGAFRHAIIFYPFCATVLVSAVGSLLMAMISGSGTGSFLIVLLADIVAAVAIITPAARQYRRRASIAATSDDESSTRHPEHPNVRVGKFGKSGGSPPDKP